MFNGLCDGFGFYKTVTVNQTFAKTLSLMPKDIIFPHYARMGTGHPSFFDTNADAFIDIVYPVEVVLFYSKVFR